jgi:hypothetical protein
MARDSLDELSNIFTSKGFQLTPLAHHNLGSSNRLILLKSSYIELLGWKKGKQVQRAEIAHQPIGLDALVFRTDDASACYRQLKEAGFAVNPVQDLSREGDFMGNKVLVEFKTVRFSEQPIPGLRIYFCEHLTPDYVWQKQWLMHPNKTQDLKKITIVSPNINQTAARFQGLLDLADTQLKFLGDCVEIALHNIKLCIQSQHTPQGVLIERVYLNQSASDPVDFIIDQHFLAHTHPSLGNHQ